MLTSRLLILNQKEAECKEMAAYFQDSGYSVIWCTEYDEATEILSRGKNKPDLLIFDVDLPKRREYEALEKIRSLSDMAVLMLSQDDKLDSQLYAYSKKIDDYMVKPFDFRELLARVRVLLKRRAVAKVDVVKEISYADLCINLERQEVRRNGEPIKLSPKEYNLLVYLVENAERVVSRVEIAEKVWNTHFDTGTNFIDVYINYLRKKMDKNFEVKLIHTKS